MIFVKSQISDIVAHAFYKYSEALYVRVGELAEW